MIKTPNLICYYPLEGNENDVSGNNKNGIYASDITYDSGNFGKCANFNGTSSYIQIPAYSYSTNCTICAWVKASFANGNQIIIGSPESLSLGLYTGFGKSLIGFASISRVFSLVTDFIDNAWNHLAVTFDGVNMSYYHNGNLLTTYSNNHWTWTDSNAYIGKRASGTFLKGSISELQIYNKALSQPDIKRVMLGMHPLNG